MTAVDPLTAYPRPPFPRPDPTSGKVTELDPRPDHGEESYVGNGRLAGLRAVVTGGDSGIGRAAAIAFAREGADVAISYLASEEPDANEIVELIEAEGAHGGRATRRYHQREVVRAACRQGREGPWRSRHPTEPRWKHNRMRR